MKALIFTNGLTTVPMIVNCSEIEETVSNNFDKGWLCINSYQSMIDSDTLAIKINTVGEYYGLYIPHHLKSCMTQQHLERMLTAAGHIY
jgi:hypothetical protein